MWQIFDFLNDLENSWSSWFVNNYPENDEIEDRYLRFYSIYKALLNHVIDIEKDNESLRDPDVYFFAESVNLEKLVKELSNLGIF
jgi:hypothetical protein